MDFKTLMIGTDISEIGNQLKEVIGMVKEENNKVQLEKGEDRVYIFLDIKHKDIIAYRMAVGILQTVDYKNEPVKSFAWLKRSIGKYTLEDIKNLVPGQDVSGIERTVRRVMPLIYGMNQLIRLTKDEKKVMIQLDISDTDIIAYQIVTAVIEPEPQSYQLVISRVLGKHNLNDYLK